MLKLLLKCFVSIIIINSLGGLILPFLESFLGFHFLSFHTLKVFLFVSALALYNNPNW